MLTDSLHQAPSCMENIVVSEVVKAFAFGKIVNFQHFDISEPFQAGWQAFFFCDGLLCISTWFTYLMFSKCPQVADPVHRYSYCSVSAALLWLSYHQLPVLLFCLHWCLLGWPGPLWSVSSPLPSPLLLGLSFSCSPAPGLGASHKVVGAEFFKTLNAFVVRAIHFLGTRGHLLTILPISTFPSVNPRNACIFLCPSFLEGTLLVESHQ